MIPLVIAIGLGFGVFFGYVGTCFLVALLKARASISNRKPKGLE